MPSPFKSKLAHSAGMGSIIVVIATNAPLLPHQCTRLAQRASIGIARTGGGTENSSGDIFLAFSTGNNNLPAADYSLQGDFTVPVDMVNDSHISALFAAAADTVEESIINALIAAETVEGNGYIAQKLEQESLLTALIECGWNKNKP